MGFLAFFDWLGEKRRKPERAGALQPADWSHTEHAAVIDHLLRPEDFKQYMGLSHCRMCDRLVGSREFTDGTWVWPEGLVHYLDLHDVRPPDDFVAWVLANSEAAAGRLACPYSRDRGIGPLPKAWRRYTHFETRDRAVHPEERARRAAEQAAAKLEEQEWIDAAPASLRSLVATNSIDFATIRVARESVLVEHRGDDMPALLALLKWCAAGTGEWRSLCGSPSWLL